MPVLCWTFYPGTNERSYIIYFVNLLQFVMIPSKQLSGLHCHTISYIFVLHNLSLSSSLRRRIGELVPLVV